MITLITGQQSTDGWVLV